jgi:alpha-1,6-mannosyltransferase
MWGWQNYLAMATSVHPFSVAPLLAFSVFSSYRFAVLWSWLVFFSYAGYTEQGFQENLLLTLLEYAVLALFIGYELYLMYYKQRSVL